MTIKHTLIITSMLERLLIRLMQRGANVSALRSAIAHLKERPAEPGVLADFVSWLVLDQTFGVMPLMTLPDHKYLLSGVVQLYGNPQQHDPTTWQKAVLWSQSLVKDCAIPCQDLMSVVLGSGADLSLSKYAAEPALNMAGSLASVPLDQNYSAIRACDALDLHALSWAMSRTQSPDQAQMVLLIVFRAQASALLTMLGMAQLAELVAAA